MPEIEVPPDKQRAGGFIFYFLILGVRPTKKLSTPRFLIYPVRMVYFYQPKLIF